MKSGLCSEGIFPLLLAPVCCVDGQISGGWSDNFKKFKKKHLRYCYHKNYTFEMDDIYTGIVLNTEIVLWQMSTQKSCSINCLAF